MSTEPPPNPPFSKGGIDAQVLFAAFAFIVALLLILQITEQAKFFDDKRFVDQPGFWPAISLGGMVLFAALHLFWSYYKNQKDQKYELSHELPSWLRALEYPFWFIAYVWLVPILGYLPATLIFCPILCCRLGYLNRNMLLWSVFSGFAVVILFKSFLQVKIPGGLLYEYLPAALRNFMIINL